jgi:hypothetical protein
MKQKFARILMALPMMAALGAAPQLSAAQDTGQQQAGGQDAQPAAAGAQSAGGAETVTEQAAAPEKQPRPITGAFGLTLGERFEPSMVARVISQKERTYSDRNKVERAGTLYQVEPKAPSDDFSTYLVATTRDGIIYAISGQYEHAEKKSTCDVTKRLAAELEEKYGKARGKGGFGNWYAFRDMSVDTYRGVRLYAPKCRNGRHSIVYSDDNAKTPAAPPEPKPEETSAP